MCCVENKLWGGGKNGSKETTYEAVTEIQADDCGGWTR